MGANDDCADGEEAPRYTDEDLFKQTPPRVECPICMLPLPLNAGENNYQACCGKLICCGCMHAVEAGDVMITCPFCRTPAPKSDGEAIEMTNRRVEANDASAIYNLGCNYYDGKYGMPQDYGKANKLWLRAGELGYTTAYFSVGNIYDNGDGVERDMKKAKYYGLAAMMGNASARYNLGHLEEDVGNMDRAVKHWMISASAGHDKSLRRIRECFLNGHATKDDSEKALRAHKDANDEMKSDQREAAAQHYRGHK